MRSLRLLSTLTEEDALEDAGERAVAVVVVVVVVAVVVVVFVDVLPLVCPQMVLMGF